MQSYRTLPAENYKRFASSKQNGSILWLDNRRQLHYIDQKFHDHLLTGLFFLQIYFIKNSFFSSVPPVMCNPPTTASALLPYHQTGIKDIDIVDLKWCPVGEVFLILFQRHLFSFEPKTQKFTQIHITRHKDYP